MNTPTETETNESAMESIIQWRPGPPPGDKPGRILILTDEIYAAVVVCDWLLMDPSVHQGNENPSLYQMDDVIAWADWPEVSDGDLATWGFK